MATTITKTITKVWESTKLTNGRHIVIELLERANNMPPTLQSKAKGGKLTTWKKQDLGFQQRKGA